MPNPTNQSTQFSASLDKYGEIGFVEQVFSSLVYVSGLPSVRQSEALVFENGDLGQVLSIRKDYVEVLLFNASAYNVGTKVARTGAPLQIPISTDVLGHVLTPLGRIEKSKTQVATVEYRAIDLAPMGLLGRDSVQNPMETGFSIVDLLVPLGVGQRELVIGDRKTGKSSFLLGVLHRQAQMGTVCIYAVIGKRTIDVKKVIDFCSERQITQQTVIVASTASDPAGLVFLTPYTAMTIAEYFRDQGKNVLLILDDMTTHAQYYREITLLARRFPGRSSYPGNIFYIQSKLLERAGSFKKGAISCLPAAESVLGDLSGYIQTNIMAITDGHIFFDTESFNQGRRPAVNPYLSVTRVGEQCQTPLLRDLSRQLSRFLAHYQRLRELVHFGSEFEDRVRKDLALGERIFSFFNQSFDQLTPVGVSILIIGALWNGAWVDADEAKLKAEIFDITEAYNANESFRQKCDRVIRSSKSFQTLVVSMREDPNLLKI